MNKDITLSGLLTFVQRNWFKLALAFLGFYLIFIKQLSFRIEVHSPDKSERKWGKRKPAEKITDSNRSAVAATDDHYDRLEVPLLTMPNKTGRNAMAELRTINDAAKEAYLKRFVKVARAEQERFSIPASIVLATALHQSTAGTRDLAVQANNHFALPCSSDWRSACRSFHGTSYRKYESAWAAFRDFSLYLDARFHHLKGGNYINYANALQNEGFGNDARIGQNLIQIIEHYGLQELDY